MATQRIHFVVHGRVQGVNFRAFTRNRAQQYDITGWVKNTKAETVEGEAQGSEENLNSFFKDIGRGPTHAAVTRIDKQERDVKVNDEPFEVRR